MLQVVDASLDREGGEMECESFRVIFLNGRVNGLVSSLPPDFQAEPNPHCLPVFLFVGRTDTRLVPSFALTVQKV